MGSAVGSPLVTASALSRAHACPSSVVMPQTPRPAGDAAEKGTALHEVVEAALLESIGGTMPTLLDPLPDEFCEWPRVRVLDEIDKLHGRNGIHAEQAFGFDGTRSVKLSGGQREYVGGDGMICGTADQVSYGGGRVVVSDLKCGKWPVYAHGTTTHNVNHQLAALAVMAAGCDKRRKIERALVAIVQCPYDATEASQVFVSEVEYDALDLAGHRHDLRVLKRKIEEARQDPDPISGDWCRFCPVDNCNERKAF